MRFLGRCCIVTLACLLIATAVCAEDVVVETLITGLHRPCGVAVQPGGLPVRHQVYVADTGAGRVIHFASNSPGRVLDVVTGFPAAAGGAGPFDQPGPRGLMFLDEYQLAVATANTRGSTISTYRVPGDLRAVSANEARQELPLPSSAWTLARTRANEAVPDLLVVTAIGRGSDRGLLQCRVQADFLGTVEPFGNRTDAGKSPLPVAVAVSPRGYVVVGWSATNGTSPHAAISVHNPANGAVLLRLNSTLRKIVAFAYSPGTGNLYAADYAAGSGDDGGIYRIDDASRPGDPACEAVKVASVRRATALAFGPNRAMYVTTYGDGDADGTLVKITGKL